MTKFLDGDKVYLRRLTKEDCQAQYLRMANDVEILSFVEGLGYRPVSVEDLQSYIESNDNASNLLLGIFERATDMHAGNIHLSQIKPYHNHCVLGIIMHRDYMKKGYAFEATNLVLKHAFEVMNMHRIQINVVDKNASAIKLYEKIGAVKDGVLRESFYFYNKHHDTIIYSILKQEYFKNL